MADDGPPEARPWVAWSGLGAAAGSVVWLVTPWLHLATFGTRPYVATGFDLLSFAGWLLMAGALVGAHDLFGDRFGRLGRIGLVFLTVGGVLVGGIRLRAVLAFVDAGFRAVPATGADPAGLLLTWAFLCGFALVFVGAGLLGVGFWRLGRRTTTAALLALTPVLVALAVALRLLAVLPLPLGALLVRTTVVFVPFGVAWLALGRLVFVTARTRS